VLEAACVCKQKAAQIMPRQQAMELRIATTPTYAAFGRAPELTVKAQIAYSKPNHVTT